MDLYTHTHTHVDEWISTRCSRNVLPEKRQTATPHATWKVLLLSSSLRVFLDDTWVREWHRIITVAARNTTFKEPLHSLQSWNLSSYKKNSRKTLSSSTKAPWGCSSSMLYFMRLAPTHHPVIPSPLCVCLTMCVPRMTVSRERHMGSSTKLQFRFSAEADALLTHSPSWEKTRQNGPMLDGLSLEGGGNWFRSSLQRLFSAGLNNSVEASWGLEAWLHPRYLLETTGVCLHAFIHRMLLAGRHGIN